MKTSLQCISSMLSWEAIVLSTYDDGGGVLTIGAGHTKHAGAPVPAPGMKIDLAEAFNIFRQDLRKYEADVQNAIVVPLTQNQFDAVVSWHFNTGSVRTATLTKKLNVGDYSGAAKEFARWNKDNGKVLKGLVDRRAHETAVFTQADYGDRPVAVMEKNGGPKKLYTPSEILELMGGAPASEEDQSTEELLANPNSRLLPRFRPQQKESVTRAIVRKFDFLIPEEARDDEVQVVAVRGYYAETFGPDASNDRNVYDDAIFVIEPGGVHNFNGNTDPSKFRRGIAKLKAPQAVRYKPGLHGFKRRNGPYPAFRQNSDITVIRDKTGEDTDSENGRFWINLHRGGNTTTSSLGCQTVPPHEWTEFKSLVDTLLDVHNQEAFYYLLVDVDDVPEEETIVDSSSSPQAPQKPTDVPDIVRVLTRAAELAQLIQRVRAGGVVASQTQQTPPEQTGTTGDLSALLQVVLSVVTQLGGVADPPTPSSQPQPQPQPTPAPAPAPTGEAETPLTPVNSALGQTVGKALDGRKTGLGILGLLATTILPIVYPPAAPIVGAVQTALTAGADAATQPAAQVAAQTPLQMIVGAGGPLFGALTGWGVLGKVDKWIAGLKK